MKVLLDSRLANIVTYATAMATISGLAPDAAQALSDHIRDQISANPDYLTLMRQVGVYFGVVAGGLIGKLNYERIKGNQQIMSVLERHLTQVGRPDLMPTH